MKCHHPDVFCAALLNAQPMGFYAPAQIVRDAREHGVEVRPVCINASRWDCTLEDPLSRGGEGEGRGGESEWLRTAPFASPQAGEGLCRLGLRMVRGPLQHPCRRILAARAEGPFARIEDVWRRSGVPVPRWRSWPMPMRSAARLDRRQALWQVRGSARSAAAAVRRRRCARGAERGAAVALTPMTEGREVVEDYRSVQLTLARPPAHLPAPGARAPRHRPLRRPRHIKDGRKVEVAGIILVRQRRARQGRHLHHHRGRDRHRQRHHLAATGSRRSAGSCCPRR
jgi:error-prone DNA polymerase